MNNVNALYNTLIVNTYLNNINIYKILILYAIPYIYFKEFPIVNIILDSFYTAI